MHEIRVKDIGPVEEFAYTMAAPGLHVLEGRNGCGKTTILRTLELVAGGDVDVKPTKRDGTPRGEASVAGATIRLAKRVVEEGELELSTVGSLSIADLHSPKGEKPVTRDKTRIATLVRLAGVKADPGLFYSLTGGDRVDFESLVPVDALHTTDLVELAARVKRALEAAARREEGFAATAQANALANEKLADGVDTSVNADQSVLDDALEDSLRSHSELVERATLAATQLEKAEAAAKSLEQMGDPPDIHRALAERHAAEGEATAAASELADLERQLQEAQRRKIATASSLDSAKSRVLAAERELSLRKELSELIASAPDTVRADEISESSAQLLRAREDVRRGSAARNAIRALEERDRQRAVAAQHNTAALRLRNAAKDTETVLTAAISRIEGCSLKVVNNDDGDVRLVISTDRSEREYFDDLSDGERWVETVRIAATQNRLIVLPQSAFGELSPESAGIVDRAARDTGCYIVTAKADDGPLRARPFMEVRS